MTDTTPAHPSPLLLAAVEAWAQHIGAPLVEASALTRIDDIAAHVLPGLCVRWHGRVVLLRTAGGSNWIYRSGEWECAVLGEHTRQCVDATLAMTPLIPQDRTYLSATEIAALEREEE